MAVPSPSGWYLVGAVGATRDLWVDVTGDGKPEYGDWTTAGGLEVHRTLSASGPEGLDVGVWWAQTDETYGLSPTATASRPAAR